MSLADDIAALQRALRLGVKSTTVDGRTVEYQSRREMVQALREMKREAGQISGGNAVSYPEFTKE